MNYFKVEYLSRKELARIFGKITITPGGCWEWTAYRDPGGYGRVRFRHTGGELVHRIIYAWAVGPIPKGQGRHVPNLDHVKCNNEACCNPVHMCLSSVRDNTLRGDGPTAQNARKTLCKFGHLLLQGNGRRYCLQCEHDRTRRIRERLDNDPVYAAKKRAYWRDYDLRRGKIKS